MVPLVPVVATTIVSVLALSSGRNMLETLRCARQDLDHDCLPTIDKSNPIASLRKLKRREIIHLFKSQCITPRSIDDLEGDWEGLLLNNNRVLTSTSYFLTNQLFGKGRQWRGKSFRRDNLGTNQFHLSSSGVADEHTFDCSLASSSIIADDLSLFLEYKAYQSRLSLWGTMVDELRVLRTADNSDFEVMVGLGSLGWSGGAWNAAPFCLYRKRTTETEK